MRITPKDGIDALRLMRRHAADLLEADDGPEEKEALQGVITMYLASKRAGDTEEEFLDWYASADISTFGDDEDEPDPTE